jgi:class 3 adenylate cyclase
MKLGIGVGTDGDPAKAARDAALQAKAAVPRPKLALAFGGIRLDQARVHAALREELGAEVLLGGSSYAEITPAGVTKDSVVVLLLDIEGLGVSFASTLVSDKPYETGRRLAAAAGKPSGAGLPLGLMFASISNGYENDALKALADGLGKVPIFGGLCCGDYDLGMSHPDFWTNYQYCGPALERKGATLALVEWPRSVKLSFASAHGWQPVAPPVRVTRARGEKALEIDGVPAVQYYRQFLGEESGDFFQLMVQRYGLALLGGNGGARLKLCVGSDEKTGAMTYFPAEELEGRQVQLIQASRRGLLEGAREAARKCLEGLGGKKPDLVLMVSCCTRNAILHSRMETEVDAVRAVLGEEVPVFGFYSGGEIVPLLNRYEDVASPRAPLGGSFYHTTTVGLLAIAGLGVSSAAVPKRIGCDGDCDSPAEAARLRGLLERGEAVLDNTESFLSNLSRKSYEDGEKFKKQSEVLRRYTPHDVWGEVGARAARGIYELEDAEFDGCFMFLDVKGFTSFSESHGPKEVVEALNALFGPATDLIYSCGGDVDKFIGDSIFAAFKDPDQALRAGRKLLLLFKESKKKGSPFSVRIGLNSGRAVRANVGSNGRREYTYIGDAVNLAQRLEANCSPGKLLICRELFELAAVPFDEVVKKELVVKGRRKPVVCYECSA